MCGRVCPGGVYVVNSYAVRGDSSLDSVRRGVYVICAAVQVVAYASPRRNGVKMA